MSHIPDELRYTASHSWVKQEADGSLIIGITDHAQESLGDIVYVELPIVGSALNTDDQIAMIESVKTASDIYAPMAGIVLAVNETLVDNPELINENPYQVWLYKFKPSDMSMVEKLLDSKGYSESINA